MVAIPLDYENDHQEKIPELSLHIQHIYPGETFEELNEKITNLLLDLSLLTAKPTSHISKERDSVYAVAAANSMAYRTRGLHKTQLRNFAYVVDPLFRLLVLDVESSVASKAAYALSMLMQSRLCMTALIECDGIDIIYKILSTVLPNNLPKLREPSNNILILVQSLAICYREIARFYPWKLVNSGALRHCVTMLNHGNVELQTIVIVGLASLSSDLEICKQMFGYGAVKPILQVTDGDKTSNPCLLAGLGCITQLSRIPEISVRVIQQGAIPVLEKALHWFKGFNNLVIREKSLFALTFLSYVESSKRLLCTPLILEGIQREFHDGTVPSRATILQFLMNIHTKYSEEPQILRNIRDDILHFLADGPWHMKNMCIKCITVLYHDLEDIQYLCDNGLISLILSIIGAKDIELQEAPVLGLLHICTHPLLPFNLLEQKVLDYIVPLLHAFDPILRELTVILLKALSLFDNKLVDSVVPEDKKYVLKRDMYNPQLFGAEYGSFIQEFLQNIVENRRAYDYLINQLSEEDLKNLNMPYEKLVMFQNLFMELDADCVGHLGEDELKLLVIMKGLKMDYEELNELINEFDREGNGTLDFRDFLYMMNSWDIRFGFGIRKWFITQIKRGPIGKATRKFFRWWNKNKIQAAEVNLAKMRRKADKTEAVQLTNTFLPGEKLKIKINNEKKLREMGFFYRPNYEQFPYEVNDEFNQFIEEVYSKSTSEKFYNDYNREYIANDSISVISNLTQ